MIALKFAVLCLDCDTISDSRTSTCPQCSAHNSLLPLARVMNPTPEHGEISYVLYGTANA